MAATFRLEIVTPDRPVLDRQVTEAQVPAENGYLGILPDHAPLLADLGTGVLSYKAEGHEESIVVLEGFVEVQPAHVRVLATAAEKPTDIDVKRAQEALDRALERLKIDVPEIDKVRVAKALRRAEARLNAAKHGR